jgi:hypothetical protein
MDRQFYHPPTTLPSTWAWLRPARICTQVDAAFPALQGALLQLLPDSSPSPPSSFSLLTSKSSLSSSPGRSRLELSGDQALLKGRKKEKGRKNRKKVGARRMKRSEGQWCLELSHCITMNMDSIKVRSAC